MKTQIKKILNLEEEYFALYEKNYGKVETKKTKYETLRLNEGDWIYCDYFKEANKVKRISGDSIEFYFTESNGITSGVLSFVENRQDIKSHRYATLQEIETRLIKEIENIKNLELKNDISYLTEKRNDELERFNDLIKAGETDARINNCFNSLLRKQKQVELAEDIWVICKLIDSGEISPRMFEVLGGLQKTMLDIMKKS